MKENGSDEFKKYSKFLDNHKHLIGLSDWSFTIEPEVKELGEDVYATVEPNIFDQSSVVELSKQFMEFDDVKKANILFHELVHCRYWVFDKKVEQLTENEEEFLINDIVRGFERFGKLKL